MRPSTHGVRMRSGSPSVWSECRCVTKTRPSRDGSSAGIESVFAASAARLTIPAPASTRYAVLSTTIATAGPE